MQLPLSWVGRAAIHKTSDSDWFQQPACCSTAKIDILIRGTRKFGGRGFVRAAEERERLARSFLFTKDCFWRRGFSANDRRCTDVLRH